MIWFLERRIRPVVGVLILLTLVVSIGCAIDNRRGGFELYERLSLVPGKVWQGEVWRLVTWIFVESSPISMFFACIALLVFGGDLEANWGTRKFARLLIAVVLVASVGTSVLALVMPVARAFPHENGYALDSALTIAWALQFPDERIRVYHMFDVGGPVLAYGTALMMVMFAVFTGAAYYLPELFAAGAALLYATGRLEGMSSSLRAWRSRRRFGVMRGGRTGGPYKQPDDQPDV